MSQIQNVTNEPDVAAAIKAGTELGRLRSQVIVPQITHGVPFVILRDKDGAERKEVVDAQYSGPGFRIGKVPLDDAESFIAYFNTHADRHSAIYAKQLPCTFVAVLDEHPGQPAAPAAPPEPPAIAPNATAEEKKKGADLAKINAVLAAAQNQLAPPRFREFRATFAPKFSKEWETWVKQDRDPFESTEALAIFIEDNLPDFVQPAGATMLEIALNFRVSQSVRYGAARRLADGHVELSYDNVVEGSAGNGGGSYGGRMSIPEEFTLRMPVLAGVNQPSYEVRARFRYRLVNGALRLWYELIRPHKVEEAAFTDLWQKIGEGTGRTILLGSPE